MKKTIRLKWPNDANPPCWGEEIRDSQKVIGTVVALVPKKKTTIVIVEAA